MSPYMLSRNEQSPEQIDLNDFQVTKNGFLPVSAPLAQLPTYYDVWEDLACGLSEFVKAKQIRQEILKLPILSTAKLHTEAEWRRAYVLLAFFTHAYIWGGDHPEEHLPSSLAVPFTTVSERLELPPVATYAALCLWNYQHSDEDTTFEDCDSLRMMHNLTGTKDEEWFYLVSVMVEGQGARSVPLMIDAIAAVHKGDHTLVIEALQELKHIIDDLAQLLERMYERCMPEVFYHEIRPMLAGSKNMAAAGLPNGVYFDLGQGKGEWKQLRGGSNAQSSLIQFFDIVLGVVHESTGSASSIGPGSDPSFHKEMRNYMPGRHRRFLEKVEQISNIRDFAMASTSHPLQKELRHVYQAAVQSLSDFRGVHLQIVARYIIIPSRKSHESGRMNLAVASQAGQTSDHALTGTGGTDLIPFLKQTREETDRAGLRS